MTIVHFFKLNSAMITTTVLNIMPIYFQIKKKYCLRHVCNITFKLNSTFKLRKNIAYGILIGLLSSVAEYS